MCAGSLQSAVLRGKNCRLQLDLAIMQSISQSTVPSRDEVSCGFFEQRRQKHTQKHTEKSETEPKLHLRSYPSARLCSWSKCCAQVPAARITLRILSRGQIYRGYLRKADTPRSFVVSQWEAEINRPGAPASAGTDPKSKDPAEIRRVIVQRGSCVHFSSSLGLSAKCFS